MIQKYPHLKNLVEDETRRPTSQSAVEGKIPGKSLLGTGHPRPVPVKTSQSQSQRPVGKARAEELFVRSRVEYNVLEVAQQPQTLFIFD